MFDAVLVANRGEIACRIITALRSLGIRSIAVYSDADAAARHVGLADEAVRIGPARPRSSYLNIGAVLEAAHRTGARAIHPGYGFLAENAEFARACESSGITFIGPSAHAVEIMGEKIRAKARVAASGVPVIPGAGEAGLSDADLAAAAAGIGFPLLIKPSAGGGGKGMHVVGRAGDLPGALARARREAGAAFGSSELLVEKLIERPRHIEVQILADAFGHTIHLGERECSLQRRHQKVIEEAPSPLVDGEMRERMGRAAVEVARSVGYRGAGTVEFIVSARSPQEFFFMEMNTRLQVEHPVTEMVTGIDLVQWQVRIAAGERLSLTQGDVAAAGHAIEARIYAEDPTTGFLPTGGRVLAFSEPRGEGIRVDSALCEGLEVTPDYDPMLAKLIAHGPDRATALDRLDRALARSGILGVGTNVEFLRFLLAHPAVQAGEVDTGLIDSLRMPTAKPDDHGLAAAALLLHTQRSAPSSGAREWDTADGWRIGEAAPIRYEFEGHGPVEFTAAEARRVIHHEPHVAQVCVDGVQRKYLYAVTDRVVHLAREGVHAQFSEKRAGTENSGGAASASPELLSPMPGTVVSILATDGQEIASGEPIVVLEAMKMEHVLRAPHAGRVSIHTAAGRQVAAKTLLATVTRPNIEEEAHEE